MISMSALGGKADMPFCTAYVRYWHKADILICSAHVRYWGNSGHWNAKLKYKFSGVPRETEFKLNLRFNLWRYEAAPLWQAVQAQATRSLTLIPVVFGADRLDRRWNNFATDLNKITLVNLQVKKPKRKFDQGLLIIGSAILTCHTSVFNLFYCHRRLPIS